MAKKGGRPFVKKNFPGMKRITNKDGKRVWLFEGKEFVTKQDIYLHKNPPKSGIDGEIEKLENDIAEAKRELSKAGAPQ